MQIMCAKYYQLRYIFKNCTSSVLVCAFDWYSVKICVIFRVRFENLRENWNMQTLF